MDQPPGQRVSRAALDKAKRAGNLVLGLAMLALGVAGAFLPVMPTTIFLILAAWFFGRSSPRLEAWMLNHPRFGPSLVQWREQGAVPRTAKIMACAGMAAGYAAFWYTVRPQPWLALAVAGFMAAAALYVTTRPAPRA